MHLKPPRHDLPFNAMPAQGLRPNQSSDQSPLSKTAYSASRQTYQETVKLLRNCGIEGVIPLPKIAIIGNQSSGKSSLIEAISKVKVPRAAETCTRCPMEVILNRSVDEVQAWHCAIALRIEHIEVPGTPRSLGPIIFATTEHKDDVTLLLRRAQLAILNPAVPLSHFQSLNETECQKYPVALKFSRNTVVLDIIGADVDVTFIDLPGIIANTEPEDDRFIDMIKDLARSYVKQEECLILVAITMKDDIDNQAAAKIARECDPYGVRTIGVLTKADTVEEGHHGPWLKVLNNESHRLRRGYYMTRLPGASEKESKQTWEETRKNEEKFFKRGPWSEAQDKSRLGIDGLVKALSTGLEEMIAKRLPNLKGEISDKMTTVQEALDDLKLPDDPQEMLWEICDEFASEIVDCTTGDSTSFTFFKDMDAEFWKLSEKINRTRPTFDVSHFDSKEIGSDSAGTPGQSPDKKGSPQGPQGTSLKAVRDIIRNKSTQEFPDITPFAVHKHFVNGFTSPWNEICLESLRKVAQLLQAVMEALCDEYFGRFKTSQLWDDARKVASEALKNQAFKAQNLIEEYCRMERNRPFTLNRHTYIAQQEEYETEFSYFRSQTRGMNQIDSSTTHGVKKTHGSRSTLYAKTPEDDGVLSFLAANGIHISSTKKLARLLDADEYKTELMVISQVLAYFQVSSVRIIDIMPMIFETIFARDYAQTLRKNLKSSLQLSGKGGYENCARFAKEEPEYQEERKRLERQRDILLEASGVISDNFR